VSVVLGGVCGVSATVGCGANCAGVADDVVSLRAFIFERTEDLLAANYNFFPQHLQHFLYIRNAVSLFTINRT
jgi:hypothetical protein